MTSDTFWLVCDVLGIVILALGAMLWLLWRAGSEPDDDEYGAPHG